MDRRDSRAGGRDREGEDFEVFFLRMLPRTVHAAQRVTVGRPAAEDAALEALTKAHLRWTSLRLEPWRDAWTLRVAINEAIRRLPRPHPPVPDRGAADVAEEIADRLLVAAALRTLPRRQREVVILRHLVGLSEVEVAAALRIGHGTVKTHLRRGLAVLRHEVDRDLREERRAPGLA